MIYTTLLSFDDGFIMRDKYFINTYLYIFSDSSAYVIYVNTFFKDEIFSMIYE